MDRFPGAGHSHTVRVYLTDGTTEDIPVKESFIIAAPTGITVRGVRSDGKPWRDVDPARVERAHEVERDVWYTRPE